MNNEIKPFEFEGHKVRAISNGEEIVFVASDIAKILGYRDAEHLTRTLDKDEKGTRPTGTLGGTQNMTVISEPGLYKAILQRQTGRMDVGVTKEFVKRFQRWVTHEVLPAIRRDGGYMVARDETPEETMARALVIAQSTIDRQKNRISELEPKALFADAVAASDGTCLVGELAKMLRQNGVEVGQNRLFAMLREDGYLGNVGQNRNVPTQRAMDLGLFRIKETAVTHSDGHVTINRTPKVTGKGQIYFVKRYCA